MSLYPSLEDMQVDRTLQAQDRARQPMVLLRFSTSRFSGEKLFHKNGFNHFINNIYRAFSGILKSLLKIVHAHWFLKD